MRKTKLQLTNKTRVVEFHKSKSVLMHFDLQDHMTSIVTGTSNNHAWTGIFLAIVMTILINYFPCLI